jgi:hypothetical protein
MRELAPRLPRALGTDEVTEPSYFDPALTYHADGTPLVMRAGGQVRRGVAAGRIAGHPYDFQVVRWNDGGTDHVAPHVLHRDNGSTDDEEWGAR